MSKFGSLISKVQAATDADNALDVAIEVALFTPDARHVSACANAAGTKVIYTRADGKQDTHWAFDYTLDDKSRALAVEALGALPLHEGSGS
jgi:hypothetical protein